MGLMMAGFDIHFQPVRPGEVYGYKTFTFGYEKSVKVNGPQALVNRWVKTLVTPKGTDATDLDYGTAFGDLFGSNISNLSNLKDAVFLAITDANDQVRQQDIEGLYSQNERLRDAILVDVRANKDTGFLETWVRISNTAGDQMVVRLTEGGTR